MHKQSDNYLSFAHEGVSLNINHIFNSKNKQQIFNKMKLLHNYCIRRKFKIYIAKKPVEIIAIIQVKPIAIPNPNLENLFINLNFLFYRYYKVWCVCSMFISNRVCNS